MRDSQSSAEPVFSIKLFKDMIYTELCTNSKETFQQWQSRLKQYCIQPNFNKQFVIESHIKSGRTCKIYKASCLESGGQAFAVKIFDKSELREDEKKLNMVA